MFKRPIIASDVGGPAERIRNGVDGLLFERANFRSLAEVIRRASLEPALWKKLQSGIREPMDEVAMADQYLALYSGLTDATIGLLSGNARSDTTAGTVGGRR